MTSRLLSFFMALIISSPACWCCVPSNPVTAEQKQKSTATAEHACCHSTQKDGEHEKQAGHNHDPSGSKEHCPCVLSKASRDKTNHEVPLPVITSWSPVLHELWLPGNYTFEDTVNKAVFRPDKDTGQNTSAVPIYQRHCSMLI